MADDGHGGPGRLTALAAAAVTTRHIRLGAAVLPIWPRHPVLVAQQAVVIAALAPGRLRIGLGVGEPSVEHVLGSRWQSPLQHLREFAFILNTLVIQDGVPDGARLRLRPVVPPSVETQRKAAVGRNALRERWQSDADTPRQ